VWGSPIINTLRSQGQPPNIILIGTDTLRADRLSLFGYRRRTSPKMTELASDGVAFSQTISPTNWTCPGFASIFTGLFPSRHQVTDYGPESPLSSSLTTLAEILRSAGWVTGAILYKTSLYSGGFDQGFDTFFDVPRDVVDADDNLRKALGWI